MADYHLAQVNIARMRGPIDAPVMADFVALLDSINALGEQSPGFVWRLKDDSGSATSIRVFEDPMLILNMSVWDSIQSLRQYTYYSDHAAAYRRRSDWFEPWDGPHLALWWVPVQHLPTPAEAKERLEYLAQHGPTPYAFTFKQPFDEVASGGYEAVS